MILASSFSAVNIVFKQSTENEIRNNLSVAKRVFTRLIESRTQHLLESSYILSSDYSFKQVVATQDRQTILSALDNLLMRIGADMAVLVSLQGQVLANTDHPYRKKAFFAAELIQRAEQQGFASSMVIIDGIPHQMVITPIMAPELKAWLCLSFKLSQMQVDELQQLTQSHISLLLARKGVLSLLISSSLAESSSKQLASVLQASNWQTEDTFSLKLDNIQYTSSVLNLSANKQVAIIAVLQKSLEEQLIPFYRLQWYLFTIASFSLLTALIASLVVSRSVSKPVKALVAGVRAVGRGNYDYRINLDRADEIGELGSAFNEMAAQQGLEESLRNEKESAESASQAKTDFLANMSHELRTPLNSILGYAQLLKTRNFSIKRQAKALDTIEQSGQHLLNLINEILDLSKIEAGQLDLQTIDFNLRDFVDNLLDVVQQSAETKGLQITTDYRFNPSTWINSDQQKLRQVLMNLLSNAIKYTERGQIGFFVTEVSKGHFHFRIEDTGIGILPEHLDSIFTSFHQLHQTQNYVEGTGLGLAISDQLVEFLGGKIKVQSQFCQGSQFSFELDLPVVTLPAHSENFLTLDSHSRNIKGSHKKILIADDNAENRDLLTDMLSPFGFLICEVTNGVECIQQAIDWNPDIILMDPRMPVMNGLEACKSIRDSAQLKHITIIVISANVYENHRKSCIEAGADGFLEKPLRLEDLLNILERHISLQAEKEPCFRLTAAAKSNERHLPSKDYLQRLMKLAQQGDIQALQQLADNIGLQEKTTEDFIKQLKNLAEGFQINKIREILTQALIEKDKEA